MARVLIEVELPAARVLRGVVLVPRRGAAASGAAGHRREALGASRGSFERGLASVSFLFALDPGRVPDDLVAERIARQDGLDLLTCAAASVAGRLGGHATPGVPVTGGAAVVLVGLAAALALRRRTR